MKKEIVDFTVKEILSRIEEIRRLEIKDRMAYVGFLIHEISGVPAVYLPLKDARYIINVLSCEIKLSDNDFS